MNDPRNSSIPDDPLALNDVDELASRFVDGFVTEQDIPDSLRSAVLARADLFARHRQLLLQTTSPIDDEKINQALTIYRQQRLRRLPRLMGIATAAASFLVVSGLVITQFGSGESQNLTSSDSEMALAVSPAEAASDQAHSQMAPAKSESATDESSLAPYAEDQPLTTIDAFASIMNGEVIEIASVAELEELAKSWPVEDLAEESALDRSKTACITDGTQRLITRRARFQGTLVEIYSSASGGLNLYAQADCDLVARLGS